MHQANLYKDARGLKLRMRWWRSKVQALIARQNVSLSSLLIEKKHNYVTSERVSLQEHLVNFDTLQPFSNHNRGSLSIVKLLYDR